MNPHVRRKLYLEELKEIARLYFIRLLGDESIPEDEADRIVAGELGGGRASKCLTIKISLLPSGEPQIGDNGYLIDNHWDTKDLCRLEIDKETAKITVTIINEMPWLRHDMLKSDTEAE